MYPVKGSVAVWENLIVIQLVLKVEESREPWAVTVSLSSNDAQPEIQFGMSVQFQCLLNPEPLLSDEVTQGLVLLRLSLSPRLPY